MRPLDGICDWAQLRPLYKLKILAGGYGDLILQLPKASFLSKFPCLLSLPHTNLKWFASFFGLSLSVCKPTIDKSVWTLKKWALGKRHLQGNPELDIGFYVGVMAYMLDACGPLCGYGDAPKTSAGLMCLFEELCRVHCDKEGKWMPAATGWPLLWAVHLVSDAKLKAKGQVRKLEEELRLETDMQVSTALLASGLEDRWESRIISRRL